MIFTIIIILLMFIVSLVIIFNKFIRYRALVREAWSGIDVQLKRRYDLIPNIVEMVKGYKQYEKNLLEQVTNIRTKAIATTTVKGKGQIEFGTYPRTGPRGTGTCRPFGLRAQISVTDQWRHG